MPDPALPPARLAFGPGGVPRSEPYDDIYHAADGGPGQARHVFLAGNGLPERWAGRERFVILENVGALLSRGLDAVLGTLASLGYDAEWHCIPASAVGAPHRRDRIWIMAYPEIVQRDGGTITRQSAWAARFPNLETVVGRTLWPTPCASMAKGSSPSSLKRRNGRDRSSDRLDHAIMAQDGGQLNPQWVEWLMGFPIGHTDLRPSATP